MNRKTANAAPRPFSPDWNDWVYISLATTEVSNWPPVIVRTMSKTFSVPTVIVLNTTTTARPDARQRHVAEHLRVVTPSSRAASTISVGMPLMAADRMTMAKPAWIQTITTIRKKVFHGGSG